MRVLLVKLTSMGDLIHALPAITDATKAIPGITFDWVVDKNFSEVASWHPSVKKIIQTSHRTWKKNPWQTYKSEEFKQFLHSLREESYDVIIDGQSNFKSALITRLAKGTRHGYDKHSVREWVAHLAYQKKHQVDKRFHAIKRLRMLFAQALNYPFVDDQPDYGILNHSFPALPFSLPKPYLYFVHNASWSTKLWPENHWHRLVEFAAQNQLNVILPWGNAEEKNRAERIASGHANAMVLPFCTLSQHAQILKESRGAICSDTGLSHLAASLNIPAVTLYGSTSISLIGTTGLYQDRMLADFPCVECYKLTCDYEGRQHEIPQCMDALKPEAVWSRFLTMQQMGKSVHI